MLRTLSLGVVLAALAAPAGAEGLEPYRMVRSLQVVQDQLARGDHAALPMQQKLLQMTDETFRAAPPAMFEDRRNIGALLVYGMSGGNPATVEVVLSRTGLQGEELRVGRGVLAYMNGNMTRASELLANADPLKASADTGAALALVKGSLAAPKQPGIALSLMDQARLLSPGTLVEEAALRRSLPLAIGLGSKERFLRLAEQYARRFLRSPYASEYADAFVQGIVAFHDSITDTEIDGVVSLMSPPQQEAIYLRLARRSTILGQTERSANASGKAAALTEGSGEDPRASLYRAIAAITSANVDTVVGELDAIDAGQLSPRDRRLLAAARAIAHEVVAPPRDEPAPSSPETSIPVDTAVDETASEPVPAATEAAAPAAAQTAGGDGDLEGLPKEMISAVRGKLDEVDRLLQEGKRP